MVYQVDNLFEILTPNILLFPDLVRQNIEKILVHCPAERLRPHIKTIKNKELINLLQEAGVYKFKCATLKEAALLAEVTAKDILLAYPLVVSNIHKYLKLILEFPDSTFRVIVESLDCAKELNTAAQKLGIQVSVVVDVNIGMNRTGVSLDKIKNLSSSLLELSNLIIEGIHGYDGHIQDDNLQDRIIQVEPVLNELFKLHKNLEKLLNRQLMLVLGGSNTFPIYSKYESIECSPGTFMLWDWGYHKTLAEQDFSCAAVLVSRVISKPTVATLCLDLGHKAIAAENPIDKRMYFVDHPSWIAISQSEEHLLVEVSLTDWEQVQIGDLQYIIPYHICPTVAKYPSYNVVRDGRVFESWNIVQRY